MRDKIFERVRTYQLKKRTCILMDSSTYDIQLFYINLKNEVTLRSRSAAFYSRSVEGKKGFLI